MITAALKVVYFIIVIAALVLWLHALANWDGEKRCKPEDCDTCPFPPCEDGPINKNERKDQHENQLQELD